MFSPRVVDADGLDQLIASLARLGFRVIGPRLRDGAIVYEGIDGVADLPRGVLDEQAGGRYRTFSEGDAYFGYVVGPSSWKRYLHPPRQALWRAGAGPDGTTIRAEPVASDRYAFVGVRACELAAIAVQDTVLRDGPFRDPHYAARREAAFIVAVNCGRAAETCFCTSMGTGPEVRAGYDVALTEIAAGGDAAFVVEAGSDNGRSLLDGLPSRPATGDDLDAAARATARARSHIRRRLETEGLADILKQRRDHPRWKEVAARCLSCANCTMVCPTCFCTSMVETGDLEGRESGRARQWASCFTTDFSYVHGGAVRPSPEARYRQWMTHKLASWIDQFGTSGCTGCGRCITWCPVGIDITEEAAAIRGE